MLKDGKSITLTYVKAHSENGANDAVDELINDVWSENKEHH